MDSKIVEFIELVFKSANEKSFVKMTLSNNKGNEQDLKNIYVKLVSIKNETKFIFTYRYKTRDIIKNYSFEEAKSEFLKFINVNQFSIVNLFSLENNAELKIDNKGIIKIKYFKNTHYEVVELNHDIEKKRIIKAKSKYLEELKITDVNGIVYKSTQDKFKQINHYIELLAPLIKEISKKETLNVVDMGSGKGYLTFALYDYLQNILKLQSRIIGVEFRDDLVKLCNEIAFNSYCENLNFEKGSILDFDSEKIDILIALHACDTATDDAIFKGIKANAQLIVVAPCCHKQIRREMETSKAKNELYFLTKYGIFMERQAEMVTDGLRALLLEYSGYTVKIQQFISDAHTPKNVMITAVRNEKLDNRKEKRKLEILSKIKEIKTFFGIKKHHLEELLFTN